MTVGIIAAMEIELELLRLAMENVEQEQISGITFYRGKLENRDVVAAVSGVGKVNAAVCTQTMILKYKPDLIINTGVAGSLSKYIKVYDVVVADKVVQHDMDTSPLGDPKGYISGLNMVEIPCDKAVSFTLMAAAKTLENTNVFSGVIATGDQFINKKADADRIAKEFNASANEMEGGSIGHVCYMNKVPFGVLRTISDGPEDESETDYNEFAAVAAGKAAQVICAFLRNLQEV